MTFDFGELAIKIGGYRFNFGVNQSL